MTVSTLTRLRRPALARLGAVILMTGSLACAAKKAPVPVASAAPEPSQRVRVGGVIKEPRIISRAEPVYPEQARMDKLEGSVIVDAVIGTDGSVTDAKVLRSSPVFQEAALTAVRQWKYTPTLLDGKPVEVLLVVVVNFKIREP